MEGDAPVMLTVENPSQVYYERLNVEATEEDKSSFQEGTQRTTTDGGAMLMTLSAKGEDRDEITDTDTRLSEEAKRLQNEKL